MNKTKKLMVAGLVGLLGACSNENYNPYDNYELESDMLNYGYILEKQDVPLTFSYGDLEGRDFDYDCFLDIYNNQGTKTEYLGKGKMFVERFDCSNLKNIIETKSGVNLDTYTHPTRDD